MSAVIRSVSSGHSGRGRSWPMPSMTTSSAPGIAPAVAPAARHVHQRVVRVVDHQGGDGDPAEVRGPVGAGDDGGHLAGHPGRVVRPVVGQACPRADRLLVEREAGGADDPRGLELARDRLVAVGGRRRVEHGLGRLGRGRRPTGRRWWT